MACSGIFAEGRVGFDETDLLPLEDGAAAFAMTSGVPVVPCAIVGTTDLWFRKRVMVRFGAPLQPPTRGREGRAHFESTLAGRGHRPAATEVSAPAATPAAPLPDGHAQRARRHRTPARVALRRQPGLAYQDLSVALEHHARAPLHTGGHHSAPNGTTRRGTNGPGEIVVSRRRPTPGRIDLRVMTAKGTHA